jgi:hypothetical protein
MIPAQRGEHVTFNGLTKTMHCAHCNESKKLEFPMRLDDFARETKKFLAEHEPHGSGVKSIFA